MKEVDIYDIKKIKLSKTPRPQQEEIFNFTKQAVLDNMKYIMIDAPVGIGKAQPLDSLALTDSGFKMIGELSYNDKIITPDGNKADIVKLHDINELDVFTITLKDGRAIECTENHLWKVFSYNLNDNWLIKDTKFLIEYLEKNKEIKTNKIYLPLISSNLNNIQDVELPIDPYLLGCLLGDGSLTQNVGIASNDEFIINKLNSIIEKDNLICKYRNKSGYNIVKTTSPLRINSLKQKLKELNLMGCKSHTKFIPDIYMNSSYEQKLQLLQGLFDTDGCVSKDGNLTIGLSNLHMITQIQELLWSIGAIATIKEKKVNYKYKIESNIKKAYRLTLQISDRTQLFSLPRKLERCNGNYQYSDLKLEIIKIEKTSNKLTRCITINSKEQLYITNNYIVTHNSYYSVMFMDWFKRNYDITAQFDILTNSKILQEQYTNDFDFMNSLWGKGSYQCDTYNTDCGTGMEWCKLQNKKCDFCPYSEAKYKFENGDVALTNFHLFLTYMVYMPGAWKRSSRVLIIDEAHDFDSVFCDFITTKISKPLLKRNGFTDEDIHRAMALFGDYPEDLTIEDFISIINDDFLNIVKSVINRLARESAEGSLESMKTLQSLNNNFLKWESLSEQYKNTPSNWILEAERIKKYNKEGHPTDEYIEMTAQPVWAYPYLDEYIWSKYDYIIFMSGTILDKQVFSKMNGLDEDLASYISIDSPFPLENRPIYYFYNTGKQTFKTKEIVWSKQKEVLRKIIKKHKKDKGIIHTANYEIQGWVEQKFNESRILTHASDNRNDVLQHHYNSDEPTVLVSPSMMTGVDLHSEYSRFQVLIKVPYPNLGSKKIKKRMETNDKWYGWKTVCDIIQSYGRSIRGYDDYADTYVLDSCFGDVLKYNKHYFPNWFLNSIHYVE